MSLSFIENNMGNLRRSEIKVADWILAHADEVIHFSISELAEKVGVSEPTIIRCCRGLGFKGFQDFKITLAQSLIPMVRNIHETVNENEQVPELIEKVFAANSNALQNTLKYLDFNAMDRAVTLLARSERIIFFGMGGSAVVAMDGHHKFFRIGIHCSWFADSHMAAMAAALMGPNQVFVAISHSGSTREVVEALNIAAGAGAETIAIVSQHTSPVSKAANLVLCVDAQETNFKLEPMSSRIAQLTLVDVLSVGVSLAHRDEVLVNLTKCRKALVDKRY
jgi:DNA-binding MurR/RpiR family transcriptional regulator